MKGPTDLAKGWFAKAESDLVNVRHMLGTTGPYDTACFHIQQTVEKYLKGFLCFHQQPHPRTHDLEVLARLCESVDPSLKLATPDVAALSAYAVKLRYDDEFWPTQNDAAAALAVAERVKGDILRVLPSLP